MTGERIKKLRKEKGLTQQQLGEMLGVQKSAIAKYENGRVPNLKKETLSRLAEIFNVTPNYLLGIDEPAYHGHSHNIDIPLYSDVCCGDGVFVEDNIEEYISLPESLLSSRKDYFCQYADGDSMIDENIQSGDLIIFEKTRASCRSSRRPSKRRWRRTPSSRRQIHPGRDCSCRRGSADRRSA